MIINKNSSDSFALGYSGTRAWLLGGLLLLSWGCLLATLESWRLIGAASLLAPLSWLAWRHHGDPGSPQAPRRLDTDGRHWRLHLANGSSWRVDLDPGSVIDYRLAFLTLRPLDGGWWRRWSQTRSLILFADQFHPGDWHELLLHLAIRQNSRMP